MREWVEELVFIIDSGASCQTNSANGAAYFNSPYLLNLIAKTVLILINDHYTTTNCLLKFLFMNYNLGIDIGTTNSVAAIATDRAHAFPVSIYNNTLLRSVVNFKNRGAVLVGSSAIRQQDVKNGYVVFNNKLVLGRKFDDMRIKHLMGLCRARVVEGAEGYCEFEIPGMGKVSPQKVVEELISVIYKSVLELRDGVLPSNIFFTIPATYSLVQKGIIRKAASQVIKDRPVYFITEPSAAAISYNLSNHLNDGYYVIYDLGGGTFDVSILKVHGDSFEIVGSSGHPTIGGSKFDHAIMTFLQGEYKELMVDYDDANLLPNRDEGILYDISLTRLLSECEKAKIILSNPGVHEAEIDIDGYFRFLNGEYRKIDPDNYDDDDCNVMQNSNITIKKDQFEQLIQKDIQTTINTTLDCMQSCEISKSDVNRVLLVGGSSSIPMVRKCLVEVFGDKKVVSNIYTQTCVSQGGALRGFMNISEINGNSLIEKCPYDIVLKKRKGFDVLIPAGTRFPYENRDKVYKLSEDNTGTIISDIYEYINGKYELVQNVVLSSDEIAYRKARVRVDFKITTSGELTVRYVDDDSESVIQEEKLVIDQQN